MKEKGYLILKIKKTKNASFGGYATMDRDPSLFIVNMIKIAGTNLFF